MTPAGEPPQPTAHRRVSEDLRDRLRRGDFADGERLPTEAELERRYGVSRQTVRRAFQDLVAEGLVHRVPGRGTFPTRVPARYARPAGSLDELMRWNESEMVVAERMVLRADPAMASRLELRSSAVAVLGIRRLFDGRPFATTEVFLPPALGQRLLERGSLDGDSRTVLRAVVELLPSALGGVRQTITAVPADPLVAEHLGLAPEVPVLRAERLFFDSGEAPVEFSVTHYHPDRYSYLLEIRANDRR